MQQTTTTSTLNNPLVTVVIPVYNVERYLEECLASVINQTYRNIEIILINDGSTDSSGAIADKIAKKDLRLQVIHKINGGLSEARNIGIKIAKGEYITFIDSDDYIDKKFIDTLLHSAFKFDADIIQCDNTRKANLMGSGINKTISITGVEAFEKLMKYKTLSPTVWAKLYKLSLFKNNGLSFPIGRLHEDTALLYKLVYFSQQITHISFTLYYYRINNTSIMNSHYSDKHYGSVIQYHNELDEFILKNNIKIANHVIFRHKALRFLSILNKIALHQIDDKDATLKIRYAYIASSFRAKSVLCFIGIIPAYLPIMFRVIGRTTPLIRNILGKT